MKAMVLLALCLLWCISAIGQSVAGAGESSSTPGQSGQQAEQKPPAEDAARAVTALADDFLETLLTLTPEFGTGRGIKGAHHGELTDNSLEGVKRLEERFDSLLQRVKSIDPAPLAGRGEWVTYGVIREALEAERERRVCHFELWNVASSSSGWQTEYTDLARIQPVGNEQLRRAALARAHALPKFIQNEIANLREGLRRGYVAPKVIVSSVIKQLEDLVTTSPDQSPFYAPAERDKDAAFRKELARVIAEEINPAIRRYRDFLTKEYLPKSRDTIGVSGIPEGVACYRATLRAYLTVKPNEEEIYQTGLAEMGRIEAEMREISNRSFKGEPLEKLLPSLRSDPRYTFRTADEILKTSEDAIKRAKAAAPKWFGRLPASDVIIEPFPEFRQKAGAPGQLQPAPEDNSRPAIFLINLYQPETKTRADAETTAFHEAVPGHHFQTAIATERQDLHPVLRSIFNPGFGEGWALYAERLADEMGVFSSDLARMGLLTSEAFRAARMVIDVGIHTKGWTRQRALDYLMAHTVLAPSIAEGEIDRYISWPGQAPSYMVGRLEIMRLREQAKRALGDSFDIRQFHDHVLENGTVPLPILEANINRWVADVQSKRKTSEVK